MPRQALLPAILLGGNVHALSAARSLSKAGVEVYALTTAFRPIRYSRRCNSVLLPGSMDEQQIRWLDWLQRGPRRGAILALSEDGVELLVRHREELLELGYVVGDSGGDVRLALTDKHATYELARKIGIETPRTLITQDTTEIRGFCSEIGFPCALKARSHVFRRHFAHSLVVVSDHEELVSVFERLSSLGFEMMMTELIPGRDDALYSYHTYIDDSGTPLFNATTRKLRLYPTGFGTECYELLVEDREVAALGLRFLQGAGLKGAGHVEFKRDARDDRLKLIECNPRLPGALELLRRGGIDFAVLAYRGALGLPVRPVTEYRTGTRVWRPARDVRAFAALRTRGELTFTSWMKSLLHKQHSEFLSWGDPLPAAVALWELTTKSVQRILHPAQADSVRPLSPRRARQDV